MQHFNVVHKPKGRGGVQYFIGNDRQLAVRTALDASRNLRKGDTVTLWSIDDKTGQQSEMACVG